MQNIPITINRDTVAISGSAPVFYVGNLILLQCSLVDADAAAVALGATSEFYATVDNVLGPDHTDLSVSADDQFNIDGDWASVDLTTGKFSARINTATSAIETLVSTDRRKSVHFEIWTRESGGAWSLLLHQEIVLYNITSDFTPTSTEGITYLTTSDLDDVVAVSDEGYTIAAPDGGDVKTFDPDSATLSQAMDFIATLARTMDSKGMI